jgi:hypothetical protein
MREMILISESFAAQGWTAEKCHKALADLSSGLALLIQGKWVLPSLRLQSGFDQIHLTADQTLLDGLLRMQKVGATRDAAVFWMRLAQKLPLQKDLPDAVMDRFLRTEPAAPLKSDAMMLCVHMAAVAVSLPTAPPWLDNQFTVIFNALFEDNIEEASETVDNLACSEHADQLVRRWQTLALAHLTPENFWGQRSIAFPVLNFGQDVQRQLASQGGHGFWTILEKLAELNASAEDWKKSSGAAPNWKTKITPESTERMKNAKFEDSRKFRSADGTARVYEWHARFGSSGRIHLCFDASSKMVEIGYIGSHLPL